MIPNPGKMNKVKGAFDKVVEWDKALIKKGIFGGETMNEL